MELHTLIGYVLALCIGISLGLIGGGGSILTIPVLVYVLDIEPLTATSYSLFVVGFTALVGAAQKIPKRLVDVRTAILFAVPSLISVLFTRQIVMPAIPEILWNIAGFVLTKKIAVMLLFAVLMLAASVSMIRGSVAVTPTTKSTDRNLIRTILQAVGVGSITGIVGAGGGFLIIPTLVFFANIPMNIAVGTSLMIIAQNSLLGFAGDVVAGKTIDWIFLLQFSAFPAIGIFIGNVLSRSMSNEKLKKFFGWFVLAMGLFIIIKELFFGR